MLGAYSMGRDRFSGRRRVRRIGRNLLRVSEDFMIGFLDVEGDEEVSYEPRYETCWCPKNEDYCICGDGKLILKELCYCTEDMCTCPLY
jgi:hypothetical protein